MPGYSTRKLQLDVGGNAYRMRVLSNLQQIADPGRVNSSRFTGVLEAQGFSLAISRWPMDDEELLPHRSQLLHQSRGMAERDPHGHV